MSKIKDMYKQLEYQQNLLLKTKLQTAIEALESGREIGEEEKEDYMFSIDEIDKLVKLMEQQGLEENKNFYSVVRHHDLDDETPAMGMLALMVNGNIVEILAKSFGKMGKFEFVTRESFLEGVDAEYKEYLERYESTVEEYTEGMLNHYRELQNLELENIKIEEPKETEVKDEGKQKIDRYANIIIEKLRIVEETDNVEEIQAPLFTFDEIKRIREVLKGKKDCFKKIYKNEDVYQYGRWVTGREISTTNIFEIGDKVVELGDYDGVSWSFVKTHEQYLEHLKHERRELTELPQRKITIEEIQEAFVEYKEIEDTTKEIQEAFLEYNKFKNAREEFEQYIKDSVPKVFGEKRPMVICKDGREYSIQASSSHYCLPKKDGLEAYEEFEVWFGEDVEEPDLEQYSTYDGIYANVPESVIVEMLVKHGGLNKELMQQRLEEQKSKYEKDDGLDDAILKMFDGNRAMAELFKLATRKSELTKKNEQAKDLLNKYEKQEGKDGQEQGDEE